MPCCRSFWGWNDLFVILVSEATCTVHRPGTVALTGRAVSRLLAEQSSAVASGQTTFLWLGIPQIFVLPDLLFEKIV